MTPSFFTSAASILVVLNLRLEGAELRKARLAMVLDAIMLYKYDVWVHL